MSGKYLAARDWFGSGELAWIDGNILAQLVSSDFRFDETDDHVPAVGTVGDPVELTNARFLDGWALCNTLAFRQVRGNEVKAIVFYARTGLPIEYHDAIENFPMQPNGGDIEIEILQPGIFRI